MKRFLLKGIINDRSRSLLPIIVVSLGVFVTVFMFCWIKGIMGESIVMNANFNTGHVKIMTRAYAKDADQIPNDLALLDVEKLLGNIKKDYPDMDWVKRIRFGALVDFPDSVGETRAQGPVTGWAIDMLTEETKEKQRFNLEASIVQGKLPQKPCEVLMSEDLAQKFKVKPGNTFTLIGSTMDGGMAFKNFIVAGTVRFGARAIDKGAIIIDIADAQKAFEMDDGAGEILGYFPFTLYDDGKAQSVKNSFNKKYSVPKDDYSPVMITLKEQAGMGEFIDEVNALIALFVFIFVFAMSVVIWNSGILGSMRRYSEFGVRLALGEDKIHVYKTLLYEGLIIGFIGSFLGTALGLGLSYYVKVVGLDLSGMMQNATLMMPTIARAEITPAAFYIGFIPGVFSMVLGNALAGIGIYKRNTARLFNELEV